MAEYITEAEFIEQLKETLVDYNAKMANNLNTIPINSLADAANIKQHLDTLYAALPDDDGSVMNWVRDDDSNLTQSLTELVEQLPPLERIKAQKALEGEVYVSASRTQLEYLFAEAGAQQIMDFKLTISDNPEKIIADDNWDLNDPEFLQDLAAYTKAANNNIHALRQEIAHNIVTHGNPKSITDENGQVLTTKAQIEAALISFKDQETWSPIANQIYSAINTEVLGAENIQENLYKTTISRPSPTQNSADPLANYDIPEDYLQNTFTLTDFVEARRALSNLDGFDESLALIITPQTPQTTAPAQTGQQTGTPAPANTGPQQSGAPTSTPPASTTQTVPTREDALAQALLIHKDAIGFEPAANATSADIVNLAIATLSITKKSDDLLPLVNANTLEEHTELLKQVSLDDKIGFLQKLHPNMLSQLQQDQAAHQANLAAHHNKIAETTKELHDYIGHDTSQPSTASLTLLRLANTITDPAALEQTIQNMSADPDEAAFAAHVEKLKQSEQGFDPAHLITLNTTLVNLNKPEAFPNFKHDHGYSADSQNALLDIINTVLQAIGLEPIAPTPAQTPAATPPANTTPPQNTTGTGTLGPTAEGEALIKTVRERHDQEIANNLADLLRRHEGKLFSADIFPDDAGNNKVINSSIDALYVQYGNAIDLNHTYTGGTGGRKEFPNFNPTATTPDAIAAERAEWIEKLDIRDKMFFIERTYSHVAGLQEQYEKAIENSDYSRLSEQQELEFAQYGDNSNVLPPAEGGSILNALRQAPNKGAFEQTRAHNILKEKLGSNFDLDVLWAAEAARRTAGENMMPELAQQGITDHSAALAALGELLKADDALGFQFSELEAQDRFFTPDAYAKLNREFAAAERAASGLTQDPDWDKVTAYGQMRDSYAREALTLFQQRAADLGVPQDQIGEALNDGRLGAHPQDLKLAYDGLRLATIDVLKALPPEALEKLEQAKQENIDNGGRGTLNQDEIKSILSGHNTGIDNGFELSLVNAAVSLAPIYKQPLETGLQPHHASYINNIEFLRRGGGKMFKQSLAHADNEAFGPMHGNPEARQELIFRLGQRLHEFDDLGYKQDVNLTYKELKADLTAQADNGDISAQNKLTALESRMSQLAVRHSSYSYGLNPDFSKQRLFDLTGDRAASYQDYLINRYVNNPPPEASPAPPAVGVNHPQRDTTQHIDINGAKIPIDANGNTTRVCQIFGAAVQSTEDLSASKFLQGKHACEESFRDNANDVTGAVKIEETGPEAITKLENTITQLSQ